MTPPPKTDEPTSGVRRDPPLYVLCFLIYLSVLPVTMLVPILKPLVADRYPVGPFGVHAFQSINMVGAILSAPLVGWLVDWFGRRRPIVASAFAIDALLIFALGFAPGYAALMIIRFLEGVAHIAALTGLMGGALGIAHRNPSRSGVVMGAVGASIVFAVACGAGLGGALSKGGIIRPLTAAFIIGIAGSALSAWALRHDRRTDTRASGRDLSVMIGVIRKEKAILIPCLFTFADRLLVGIMISSFALYLAQVLGRPPSSIGLLMTLLMIPFAVLCYPCGKLCHHWSKSAIVVVASLMYGSLIAALGWVPAGWLPGFMLLLGVVSALNFSPSLAMVSDLAGPELRSTAMGAFNSAGSLGFFSGPLLGGAIVQATGGAGSGSAYALAFIAGGSISIATTLIAIPFLIRLVREGRTT